MSLEATSWALKETWLNKPCLRLMLILLSESHSGDTVSVMPELSTLAESFPCREDKAEEILSELVSSRFLWLSEDAKLFAFPSLDWSAQ